MVIKPAVIDVLQLEAGFAKDIGVVAKNSNSSSKLLLG